MRKYKFIVLVAILLFVIPLTAQVEATKSPKTSIGGEATADESSSAPIDVQAGFGKLPLSFIPNVGQSDAKVEFQTHAYGGTVFFTDEEIVLALPASVGESGEKELQDSELTTDKTRPMTVARLSFEGRSGAAPIYGSSKLPGIVNYYRGSDPDNWFSGVPTYGGIVYKELYRGIDLHYDGENGLKSTFVVAPGTDPKQIRWRYKGAEEISVNKSGQLHVALDMPEELASSAPAILIEQAPIAWQEKNGEEVAVKIGYTIARDGSIGFELGEYDRTKPLILDPTLTYSTYLGGSENDYAFSNALDSQGNLYLTGATFSIDFPTSEPPSGLNGNRDVFVSKLNPEGNDLLYSTYLGGEGEESGHDIAVDDMGAVYIAGHTDSEKFPIVNAYQSKYGGGAYDAFVTYLNSAGQFQYSTYLGSNGTDSANGVAIDTIDSNRIYITGHTSSDKFPILNAYQAAFNGVTDAFVTKLSWNGGGQVQLDYGTYLGGSDNDNARALVLDQDNNIYITGYTTSSDFPLNNAYQDQNDGEFDVFVAKLDPTQTAAKQLVYSTYLGGSGLDGPTAIAVDGDYHAYIAGYTRSLNFDTTLGVLQETSRGGESEGFMTKLSSEGNALLYSTYFGGNSNDGIASIAVNNSGIAYLTGQTNSTDFYTVNALQATLASNNGTSDVFVAALGNQGQALGFSTYLGGEFSDTAFDIAVNNSNELYIVGGSHSANFPLEKPLFSTHSGASDAFATKITLEPPTTQLAYFYRDSTDAFSNASHIATRSELVILHKRNADRLLLEAFRENGYDKKSLQYVVANEVQNPHCLDGDPEPDPKPASPWNNQWAWEEGDWDDINENHPDWFLYRLVDNQYERIPITDFESKNPCVEASGFYHMDPNNPGWQQFVYERTIEFITDADGRGDYNFEGLFLDNVDVTWNKVWRHAGGDEQTNPNVVLHKCTTNRREGLNCEEAYGDSDSYRDAVVGFLGIVKQALNAADLPAKHPRLLWGNMISDNHEGLTWTPFLGVLDGGMFEGWTPGYPNFDLSAAKREDMLEQAEEWLSAEPGNRQFLAVGQGPEDDINRQQYALASYLLVVPENNTGQAMFRYTRADDDYNLWWYYDNYDYRLGTPLGARYQPDADNVPHQWRRNFQNGYVTLDTQSLKHQIVLNSGASTVQVRVVDGNDDAEQNLSSGFVNLDSSDLELVFDGKTEQMVGLRFQNVAIPQEATIIRAYLEFTVDEVSTSKTNLTFLGEAQGNPSAFNKIDLISRKTTKASVEWNNIPAWNVIGQTHQTSDLSDIVQEIVNLSSWQNGNAMVFMITGFGTRTAESYDGAPDSAPLLYIEYIE